MFPDLSPLARSDAALLTRWWDTILGDGYLTSFLDTSLFLANKKVATVTSWEAASKQI